MWFWASQAQSIDSLEPLRLVCWGLALLSFASGARLYIEYRNRAVAAVQPALVGMQLRR